MEVPTAGTGNHAFTAGRVQIDQQIAVGIAHLAALVPAPHPGVAQRVRVALGIGGEHIRRHADSTSVTIRLASSTLLTCAMTPAGTGLMPGWRANSNQSSVISIQSPILKCITESRPTLATVNLSSAVIAVTLVATEALSRDHLNVAVPLAPPS